MRFLAALLRLRLAVALRVAGHYQQQESCRVCQYFLDLAWNIPFCPIHHHGLRLLEHRYIRFRLLNMAEPDSAVFSCSRSFRSGNTHCHVTESPTVSPSAAACPLCSPSTSTTGIRAPIVIVLDVSVCRPGTSSMWILSLMKTISKSNAAFFNLKLALESGSP